MSIGAIELATIARSQDYSGIRQNENNKVNVDQSNIMGQVHKETEQKSRQVQEGAKTDWYHQKYDAKEKGNGQYSGDGGQNRRKEQDKDGKVLLKGHESFDIKI